jgi:hypothetical protein
MESIPFYAILSLQREIISDIGFFFSLAIEMAYNTASSSVCPLIICLFATKRGISYSPKAQKMDWGNNLGSLSYFLNVWALLQLAAMRIISGLYSLM